MTTAPAATSPGRGSSRVAITTTTVVVATRPGCSTASRATLPGLESALSPAIAFSSAGSVAGVLDGTARLATSTAHLGHESVELVFRSATDARLLTAVAKSIIVAPGLSDLALGTIARHVAGLTTDAANDTGCEILLLWAVVLAMTDFTAVLAGLVLVVTKGTVESGEFSELVALELVLAFRDRGGLELLVSDVA